MAVGWCELVEVSNTAQKEEKNKYATSLSMLSIEISIEDEKMHITYQNSNHSPVIGRTAYQQASETVEWTEPVWKPIRRHINQMRELISDRQTL